MRSLEFSRLQRARLSPGSRFGGNFRERSAGQDGAIVLVNVPGRCGRVILVLDHQPLGLLLAAPGTHKNEAAHELFAAEPELDFTSCPLLLGIEIALDVEPATVPNHHRTRTIIALRNDSFEIGVAHGVIFSLHRHAFIGGIQRGPFGNSPGLERTVDGQAKIVMQAARGVLLDDECAVELRSSLGGSRLGSAIESPFTAILVEARHRPF